MVPNLSKSQAFSKNLSSLGKGPLLSPDFKQFTSEIYPHTTIHWYIPRYFTHSYPDQKIHTLHIIFKHTIRLHTAH